jgi:hypothetical protein
MISIHAAADLMAQWWDLYACRQSKQFLEIPLEFRHCMVLLCLEKEECVKHTGDEDLGEIEYWNLSDKMSGSLKGERLSRIRHEIRLPEEANINRHQMTMYAKTLKRGLSRKKNHRDCKDFISELLISIAKGDVELLGWDEHGLMKFSITAQSSTKTCGYGIYSQ